MLDVFSSIGEDVMVGVGCTARRDARNSDLLKIDEIDPTYAWTLPTVFGRNPRTESIYHHVYHAGHAVYTRSAHCGTGWRTHGRAAAHWPLALRCAWLWR
jgi:hypothetical protein